MNTKPSQLTAGNKLRDADKMSHIPIKVIPSDKNTILKKHIHIL